MTYIATSLYVSKWIPDFRLASLLCWVAVAMLFFGSCESAESSRVRMIHNADQVVLLSSSFRVSVDRHTGLPSAIESLEPTPVCLWDNTGRSLEIAVEDRNRTWDKAFDRLSDIKTLEGRDTVGRYVGIRSDLQADGIDGYAVLEMRLYADRLDIATKVRFNSPPDCSITVRLGQPYSPALWTQTVFFEPQGRAMVTRPDQKRLRKYADSPSDRVVDDFSSDSWKWLTSRLSTRTVDGWSLDNIGTPRGILEAEDRFLLYGNLDLRGFEILAVDWRGCCPCLLRMPKQVKPGDELKFNLTYKVFPKPEFTLGDVCRWYSRNVRSSNDLSTGIVASQSGTAPRTLGYGNVFVPFEDKNIGAHTELAMKHLWFFKQDDEVPAPLSTDESALIARICDTQRQGTKVYAYFRQLAHESKFHNERPRFRDWALRPRANMLWGWSVGPIGCSSIAWTGTGELSDGGNWLAEDFCNPDFMNWYISDVKSFIDRYRPDGIAWDMGWDTYISPCIRHPDAGICHGILRVQREIYEYIKQHHPQMKVIQNESVGSPSMLYCDAVMSEEGTGISREMLANVDHFRITLVGLYYCWTYKKLYGEEWEQNYIHDVMRNLSYGFTWGAGDFDSVAGSRRLMALKKVAEFSATANSLPRVIEKDCLDVGRTDNSLSGRVWAGRNQMLAAIYNDGNASASLRAEIKSKILLGRFYGFSRSGIPDLTVIGKDGVPVPGDMRAEYANGNLVLVGRLPPEHLLLVESVQK